MTVLERAATEQTCGLGRNVFELMSLKGKVALVTGGAGRYGSQISRALAEAGASVIVASRDAARCDGFAETLRREGFDGHAMALDITSCASVEGAAARVRSRWGKLDVLFNNAALVSAGALADYSVEDWERAMTANSTALYRCSKVFGEMMRSERRGSIVNVGSIYGVVSPDFRIYDGYEGYTNPPSYGFAKAGMIQLTRYLAVELGRYGVRVNAISPGGLHSPALAPPFVERYCARTPLGRMASDSDIKGVAVLLASDAGAYVTGQNFIVDGGLTAL